MIMRNNQFNWLSETLAKCKFREISANNPKWEFSSGFQCEIWQAYTLECMSYLLPRVNPKIYST
jgi:hypothetical protein